MPVRHCSLPSRALAVFISPAAPRSPCNSVIACQSISICSATADIDHGMLDRMHRVFGDAVKIMPLVNNSDELTILANGVKITFLRYPFPLLAPFVMYDNVPLLSVCEIAATKAYTIGRRGSFKDYVDLYFVVAEQRATLAGIIAEAEDKFGSDFNARLFLEQLVYLADLDDGEVQFIKPIASPREVQTFFEDRIRELGDAL